MSAAEDSLYESAEEIYPQTLDLYCDHRIHPHPINNCMVWHQIRTAEMVIEMVIECNLLSLQDIYGRRDRKHAGKIKADPFHPRHRLFHMLPSRRINRVIAARKSRHTKSILQTAFCFPPQWSSLIIL